MEPITFVGLDVHKRMTSVAIAEAGRGGEVRFMGEIPSTPEALHRLVERLKGHHRQEQPLIGMGTMETSPAICWRTKPGVVQ